MVSLKASYTVKPASPTPAHGLWLSELDQDKPIIHTPTIYFYRPVGDAAIHAIEILRESLSRTLVHFYPFAGRLKCIEGARLELNCNATGAELLEAESEAKIDDFGDFKPTPEIRKLIPRVDYTAPINELPLLLVQLTRFRCGGISIGAGLSHVVADGRSALHFFSEWTRRARGEEMETPPFLDRTVLRSQNPETKPRFDHVEYSEPPLLIGKTDERSKETTVAMLKLTKEQVEKLRNRANEERMEDNRPYSRYEAIAAHMWRSACKARGHEANQETRIRVPVEFRNRLDPPLPSEYFGNAILAMQPTALSGDLVRKRLGYAASLIRGAIDQVTDDYVRSAIDCLRGQPDLSVFRVFHTLGCTTCTRGAFFGNPNLLVASWIGLPFETDFGWGKAIYMGPGALGFDGLSYIIPAWDGDESLIIPLRLQVAHMEAFKKFFYEDI